MNRKLINGLLLLTVATGGVGTFTSCKDNEYVDKIENNETLSNLVGMLQKLIDEKQDKGDYATVAELEALKDRVKKLEDAGYLTQADKEALEALIKKAQDTADGAQDAADAAMKEAKDARAAADAAKTAADKAQAAADAAQGTADEALKKAEAAQAAADAAAAEAEAAKKEALAAALSANQAKDAVKNLTNYVNTITAQLVTSIQIQRCYNPMFGTFNLPMGISSTILANYYYYADHDINFPNNNNSDYEYNQANNAGDLGDARWSALGFAAGNAKDKIAGKTQLIESLGNLYVTVNPTNIDCSGMSVRLVKSNGEYVLGKLELAKATDIEFDFGYTHGTRAGVENGLYRVVVTPETKDIEDIKIDIDPALKEAAKNLYHNRTKSSVADLAAAIYRQFDGILPAYAVEFTPVFKDKDGNDITIDNTRTLLTKYELAATTFRPLSFRTGEGFSTDHRLPTFGRVKDALDRFFNDIKKDISFNLNLGVDEEKYKIDLDLSKVEFNIEPEKIAVDIPALNIIENGSVVGQTEPKTIYLGYSSDGTVTGNDAALNPLVDAINKAVKEMLTGDENSIEAIIEAEVVSKMNDLIADINGQLKSVDGQINDQVSDILDKIENQIAGKLDAVHAQKFVELYNRVANKVNSMIENPNAYLQVYAAYKDGNGDLHHLSTLANDPSIFEKGNGNSIELFLTSYNAELLVPVYKKYVAVVGEVGNEAANLKALNNGGAGLNQVLPGTVNRAGIPVANLEKGKIYEILYTALDFRGFTSSRRYYISVK